ncbi:MAG TPA: hypothetical protein VH092_35155 [Urbifossiella sp.]|jgi:hypothetical protein|nr:hypothetical protein [Urbifossiella sp.]
MTTLPTLHLVTSLRAAFERGPAAAPDLDRLLGPADPVADVRTLLAMADPGRLRVLRDRLYDGDVIAHCFRRTAGGRVQGCVMFWLTGVTSVAELLAREFPSGDHLRAVCRSVRAWDDGTLTPDAVFAELEAALWNAAHADDPPDVLLPEPAEAR